MTDYIPKEECKNRGFYIIHSRNLTAGVFREETGGFLGIREKFYGFYVFEEYHYDNGSPFGTVRPQEFTEVYLPDEIPLVDYLPDTRPCSICGRETEYVKHPEDERPIREYVKKNGEVHKQAILGYNTHVEDGSDIKTCEKGSDDFAAPRAVMNRPLFDWLMERDHSMRDWYEKVQKDKQEHSNDDDLTNRNERLRGASGVLGPQSYGPKANEV